MQMLWFQMNEGSSCPTCQKCAVSGGGELKDGSGAVEMEQLQIWRRPGEEALCN